MPTLTMSATRSVRSYSNSRTGMNKAVRRARNGWQTHFDVSDLSSVDAQDIAPRRAVDAL